jgi:hypothetical protein
VDRAIAETVFFLAVVSSGYSRPRVPTKAIYRRNFNENSEFGCDSGPCSPAIADRPSGSRKKFSEKVP